MTVFEFSLLCHLLNVLEQNHAKNKSALSRIADSDMQTVRTWFNVMFGAGRQALCRIVGQNGSRGLASFDAAVVNGASQIFDKLSQNAADG